jgi:hypothetical protein
MKRYITLLILLGFVSIMQITEADIKDLTLTASVRQASYRLAANSPIWIDLTIANNTTKPIDIDIPAIRNHAVTAIPVNGNTNVVEPLPKAYYLLANLFLIEFCSIRRVKLKVAGSLI